MATGSSPLTRGKLGLDRGLRNQRGLIPAHAGKTGPTNPCPPTPRAHPRSRGENVRRCRRGRGRGGSSPLTRGKPRAPDQRGLRRGLIPAHAGKTSSGDCRAYPAWAHPRSRGENVCFRCQHGRGSGSSPLTRGKHWILWPSAGPKGLIPAHAGKTPALVADGSCATAHPRSRGENCGGADGVVEEFGSSPLTRGKHFLTCAFTAQIDQILETLELAASFGSYLIWVACATDAPQDPVRSIGLVLPSSMGAS